MKALLVLILLYVYTIQNVEASKILCVFPSSSKSHLIVAKALLKELAVRGHEVTMISSFPQSKPVKNYHDIVLPVDKQHSVIMKKFIEGQTGLKVMSALVGMTLDGSNQTMNNHEVQKLMKQGSFDLVIVGFFIADFTLGLGAHFKCPTVILCTAGAVRFVTDYVGNPVTPATVPHLFLGNKNPMTFIERVKNLLFHAGEVGMMQYISYKQEPYYTSNFPPETYPSYESIRKNVSLVLVNQHFSQALPRPYLQNVVEVGGLQIKQTPSPLPEKFQEWLDGAEFGFIFLSFGSNLKFSEMPRDKLSAFINVLSKLKQRIIWTYDTDFMDNKPDNVMIGKWLPQDDILAHKNIKLFISHCGLGSVLEAKYHAVPILGMPVFADQSTNIQTILKEGWGVYVDYATLSEEKLATGINEVVNNPKYKNKVNELSALFRDRPQSAMDLATFWIEYVIRHKGAPHMHYQGVDLNFFQSTSLDVIFFIIAIIYILFKTLIFIAKLVFKFCKNKKVKTN